MIVLSRAYDAITARSTIYVVDLVASTDRVVARQGIYGGCLIQSCSRRREQVRIVRQNIDVFAGKTRVLAGPRLRGLIVVVRVRLIVGAGDGDRDGLGDREAVVVREGDVEGLDLAVAVAEVLSRRGRDRVVPGHDTAGAGAGRVGRDGRSERAEGRAGPCVGAGRRNAVDVRQIDVGEGDRAAVGEVADRGDLLGHRADEDLRRDHRGVVGARDGDRDGLGDREAVVVREGDVEGLDLAVAVAKVLSRRGRDRVVPGHDTAGAGAGRVGRDGRSERAEGRAGPC